MPRPRASKIRPASLTPKQLRLLTYIRDYTNARGYAPTMQELADEFEISKVTVFEHISSLQEKGYLKRSRHKARSLQLNASYEFPDERPTKLPLVGRIAAGRPIEAIEDREILDLETMFVSRYPTFVLRVRGDSMIEDNICDGDFVICERRETARDGEVVVALVDGEEATLKRLYRTPGGIKLQPANPAYEPIISKNVQVQGVVVGLLRQF
ncbi:MAG: transcriptional repressor LexA [Phycisphaerales bacterium]|nr:transcriptional repressor LexA [Phycisphaerales bacterium]